MDHFQYYNGILHAEEVPVPVIANAIGTPFYCYSTATLVRHYTIFAEAFEEIPTTICFAVKANSNLAVLKTLAQLGSGADTVSEGEIRRARAAGIPAEKIVFSGVGKTRNEMRYALGINIGQFNVESLEELIVLDEEARALGATARITVRVNPDVDAGSHDKISTGRKGDKFGVAWDQVMAVYDKAKELKGIEVVGVTCHIGSQLTQLQPFENAFAKVSQLVEDLREAGHTISKLDLGGGLGIPYETGKEAPPHPKEYAAMIVDTVKHLDCELVLEPGRLIAGNAGILVAKVTLVKATSDRTFVVLDAAMNDILRPSMYDAYHEIATVAEPPENAVMTPVDVVGPVCETADAFGKERLLPPMAMDDLIYIRSCGAYGAVMSSTYNTRLLIPEVMVNGVDYAVIRERQDYEALLGQDILPDWLAQE